MLAEVKDLQLLQNRIEKFIYLTKQLFYNYVFRLIRIGQAGPAYTNIHAQNYRRFINNIMNS